MGISAVDDAQPMLGKGRALERNGAQAARTLGSETAAVQALGVLVVGFRG